MRSTTFLLQLLAGGALVMAAAAAASSSATAVEWGSGVEHRDDDSGLVCNSSEAQRALVLERALGALRDDFVVQRGNLSFVSICDGLSDASDRPLPITDLTRPNLSHAQHLGGNPQGRYGVGVFSEDLLPPGLKKASKVTAGFPIPVNASWTVGPQDAVFWFGCTPPPARYFSIRSYLAYRFLPAGEDEAKYNLTGLMPAAELGPPTNNAVMKTTGAPGSPFSKTTLFVSTGDEATYRQIRKAFGAAGFPETAMNLDVLPAEKVSFRHKHLPWVADRADTVAWQFRVNVSDLGYSVWVDCFVRISVISSRVDSMFGRLIYRPPPPPQTTTHHYHRNSSTAARPRPT